MSFSLTQTPPSSGVYGYLSPSTISCWGLALHHVCRSFTLRWWTNFGPGLVRQKWICLLAWHPLSPVVLSDAEKLSLPVGRYICTCIMARKELYTFLHLQIFPPLFEWVRQKQLTVILTASGHHSAMGSSLDSLQKWLKNFKLFSNLCLVCKIWNGFPFLHYVTLFIL